MTALRLNVCAALVVTAACLASAGGWQAAPPPTQGEKPRTEADARQAAVAAKLKEFAYPGSKRENDSILASVGQTVAFTTDDLKSVEAWYRKKLHIDAAFIGGVAHVPWPPGSTALVKERWQWGVAQDDVRPKRDGSGKKAIRAGTVRHFVVRTPEGTLTVLLNRTPADAETMIAVTFLPADAK